MLLGSPATGASSTQHGYAVAVPRKSHGKMSTPMLEFSNAQSLCDSRTPVNSIINLYFMRPTRCSQ